MLASQRKSTFLQDQGYRNFASTVRKIYKTKRMPCAIPVILTISGLPAKYFRGIAIASKRMNDTPSTMPVKRRRPMVVDKVILFKDSPVFNLFKKVAY